MTNPKPCPFCGGDRISTEAAYAPSGNQIMCLDCDATGPNGRTEAEARELWNQRVPINPSTGEPYFKVSREGWGEGWEGGPVFTQRIEK